MTLHSHVLRTTTRELPDLLNEWATRENRPGEPAEEIHPTYCGGRDWVVVIRHRDHGPQADSEHYRSEAPHDARREDPRYLDSIGDTGPDYAGLHEQIAEWFEAHPDLIGEGSASDNAVRLLAHAYDPDSCEDPGRLSVHTPTLVPQNTEHVTYEWQRLPRSGDYDDLLLARKVTEGEVGYTDTVWSTPLYRHDYSPEDVLRLLRDAVGCLTAPRTERAVK